MTIAALEPCLRAYMIRKPDAHVEPRTNDSIASTREEAVAAYKRLRERDWRPGVVADHFLVEKAAVDDYWGFVLVYCYPISRVLV